MQKISIELALRDLRAFVRREWRLALPVALAFLALPPLLLNILVSPYVRAMPATVDGMRRLGLTLPGWTLPLMLAGGVMTVVGALTLMTLVLVPRVSVREAIGEGVRRLPAWIGAALILGIAIFAGLIVVGLLVGSIQAGMVLLWVATLIGIVVASLYLMLIAPLMIDRRAGPIAALRQGWTVYRGALPRAAGGLGLFLLGWWIVGLAVQLTLGSALLLAGRALGQEDAGRTLLALVAALVTALQWGSFYLLVAILYRQRAAG